MDMIVLEKMGALKATKAPAGPVGPAGPAGGVLNYADFYALMPPDQFNLNSQKPCR